MHIAKPLKIRLFLEGEEVPVVAAQVTIRPNAPAAASIQVVPIDSGMDLKPRTMVHLFYLDTKTTIEEDKTLGEFKATGFTGAYRLLFSGEAIGYSFVKSPFNRALILQCVDFSSYWDACHATAVEYGPNGNLFTNMGSFYGGNVGVFDDIVDHQQEMLVRWLRERPKTPGLETVSGLAGGIIRILEVIGGVPGNHKGLNDFFTIGELRCRILSQITAEENDQTAANLLDEKVFRQWIKSGLQNAGQQVTFRDILKLLCGYIYYDVIPNPVAKIEESSSKSIPKRRVYEDPSVKEVIKLLETVKSWLSSPIKGGKESVLSQALQVLTSSRGKLTTASNMLTIIYAKSSEKPSSIKRAQDEVSRASVVVDSLIKNKDAAGVKEPLQNVNRAINNLKNAVEVLYRAYTINKSERLRTQIVRPDCWFAPPPKCNVIFPEQYSQMAYDRIWINEVTRSLIMLYDYLVHQPGSQMSTILAPRVITPDIGKAAAILAKKTGKAGYTVLMPHEYHTGIVPRVEMMSDIASVPPDAQVKQRFTAQNVGMFHFFKFRFGPRSLNLSGRFNPNLVCAFPGAVITSPFYIKEFSSGKKALSSDTATFINDYALKVGAPTHFVGMIESVAHNVDQQGGTTNVSMSHVRRHSGVDDEFFDVFTQTNKNRVVRVRVPLLYENLKATNNNRVLQLLADATPKEALTVETNRQTLLKQNSSTIPSPSNTPFIVESAQKLLGASQSGELSFELNKAATDQAKKNLEETQASFASGQILGAQALGIGPGFETPTEVVKSSKTRDSQKISISGGKRESVLSSKKVDLLVEVGKPPIPTTAKVSIPGTRVGTIQGIKENVNIPDPFGSLKPPQNGVFGKIIGIEVTGPIIKDSEFGNVYSQAVFHEDVTLTGVVERPLEELLFPPWFSPKYLNSSIGKEIYQPFFGCDSIVDELIASGPNRATTQQTTIGRAVNADSSPAEIKKLLAEEATRFSKASVERAINLTAYLYGVVKSQGLDVEAFLEQFNYRSIATKEQILGSEDLELSVSGTTVTVTKGTTGFHSMAVHPTVVSNKSRLLGLLQDPSIKISRLKGDAQSIVPDYDVRFEKREKVMKYKIALLAQRAFQG